MIKYVFALALLFVVVVALCPRSPAQVETCRLDHNHWVGDASVPGEVCYQGESWNFTPCTSRTYKCPVAAAAKEVNSCSVPSTASDALPGFANSPIDLANCNTFIVQNDLAVPGIGGGIHLTRTWNSRWPDTQSALQQGLFGLSWRSNFEERVFVGADGTIKYGLGDGSFWSFGLDPVTGKFLLAAPSNGGASLDAAIGSPIDYWTLTLRNGEQRRFSKAIGSLIAIIDRNGNTTQLSYDGANRLTTVTDPASRHIYFNYPNGSSYLVSSITTDFGVSLSYGYDAQSRLTTVTKADGTIETFTYNAQSLITAVKDSDGKILESHSYDASGRDIAASRANGVDAVTITYPQ